jgi:hypothetical protein
LYPTSDARVRLQNNPTLSAQERGELKREVKKQDKRERARIRFLYSHLNSLCHRLKFEPEKAVQTVLQSAGAFLLSHVMSPEGSVMVPAGSSRQRKRQLAELLQHIDSVTKLAARISDSNESFETQRTLISIPSKVVGGMSDIPSVHIEGGRAQGLQVPSESLDEPPHNIPDSAHVEKHITQRLSEEYMSDDEFESVPTEPRDLTFHAPRSSRVSRSSSSSTSSTLPTASSSPLFPSSSSSFSCFLFSCSLTSFLFYLSFSLPDSFLSISSLRNSI